MTLLLSRSDVQRVLNMEEAIEIVRSTSKLCQDHPHQPTPTYRPDQNELIRTPAADRDARLRPPARGAGGRRGGVGGLVTLGYQRGAL